MRTGGILNGRILLTRDGTTWRGVIHHGDGSRWSIVDTTKEVKVKEKPERKKEKTPV